MFIWHYATVRNQGWIRDRTRDMPERWWKSSHLVFVLPLDIFYIYSTYCRPCDGAAKFIPTTLGFPAVPKPFEVAVPLFVTQPNITDVPVFFVILFFSYFLCFSFSSIFFFFFSSFSYFLVFFDPFYWKFTISASFRATDHSDKADIESSEYPVYIPEIPIYIFLYIVCKNRDR